MINKKLFFTILRLLVFTTVLFAPLSTFSNDAGIESGMGNDRIEACKSAKNNAYSTAYRFKSSWCAGRDKNYCDTVSILVSPCDCGQLMPSMIWECLVEWKVQPYGYPM
jgi:hypothetical protein